MVKESSSHNLYERILGLQFSSRMSYFKTRIFVCFLLLITFAIIIFASESPSISWLQKIAGRIDYIQVCSLLSAFNMSNHPQSLSPGLHAAAAALVDKNPGKIELLLKASLLDKQFTPYESRGRSLTKSTFWVVLSCTDDPMYAFSLPMVSLAWLKIAGARPLVFLIGSGFQPGNSEHPKNSWIPLMIQTLQELFIEFVVLDSHGVTPTTFAQVSRLFGIKLQVGNQVAQKCAAEQPTL